LSTQDVYSSRGFGGRQGVGRQAALVVVDLSYGFTDPASPLHCDTDDAVVAVAKLLDAARAGGAPVVFTTVCFEEADLTTAATFITKAPAMAELRPGSHWVAIDERIAPHPGEPVLNKLFASAFFGTSLATMLGARGVDTLVVTGASTSGCVRATVVDGVQYGMRVLVPTEAVADRAPGPHDAALLDIDAKYGDVVTLDEAVAALSRTVS